MPDVILWIYNHQSWVYGLLIAFCVGALYLIWRTQGRVRYTVFTVERERLAGHRNIYLLLAFIFVALLLSTLISNFFLVPNLSDLFGVPPTPTAIRPTLTPEPSVTPELVLPGFESPTPDVQAGPPATRTPVPAGGSGCMFPLATITSPIPGAILAGVVEIRGTANIDNFAFYVLEVSTLGDNWLTVVTSSPDEQGNPKPVIDDVLGSWNSALIDPGDYALRLVVYDSAGNHPAACTIPITIQAPAPTPTDTP